MADELERRLGECLRIVDALIDAMRAAVQGADPADRWRFASYKQFMRKYMDVVTMTNALEPIQAPIDAYDMTKVPSPMDSLAITQQELFEGTRANLLILRAYLENRVNPKSQRISEIADFLQSSVRRAVLARPEREKDVQDVIEQLLIGRGLEKGLDYDREVGRVKTSAKEVIPDFVLPQLGTAIEVKLLKEGTSLGRTIDEVNADIRAYGQTYRAIVFVIYDAVGAIRDEAEFRRDLEAVDGVKVIVAKH